MRSGMPRRPCRGTAKSVNRPRLEGVHVSVLRSSHPSQGGLWLYGLHAVRAPLANKQRRVKRAVRTERAASESGKPLMGRVRFEIVAADAVSRVLPQGAVHQGVALQCEPLPKRGLENALAQSVEGPRIVIVL